MTSIIFYYDPHLNRIQYVWQYPYLNDHLQKHGRLSCWSKAAKSGTIIVKTLNLLTVDFAEKNPWFLADAFAKKLQQHDWTRKPLSKAYDYFPELFI